MRFSRSTLLRHTFQFIYPAWLSVVLVLCCAATFMRPPKGHLIDVLYPHKVTYVPVRVAKYMLNDMDFSVCGDEAVPSLRTLTPPVYEEPPIPAHDSIRYVNILLCGKSYFYYYTTLAPWTKVKPLHSFDVKFPKIHVNPGDLRKCDMGNLEAFIGKVAQRQNMEPDSGGTTTVVVFTLTNHERYENLVHTFDLLNKCNSRRYMNKINLSPEEMQVLDILEKGKHS